MDSKEKDTKSKPSSRRRFLKQGAALAGLATMGGIGSVRGQKSESRVPDERSFESFYGVPSHFENTVREMAPNQYPHMLSALTPHQDSVGIITPSGLHFLNLRNHDAPPSIDPQQHRLLIHGLVDRPLSFTMDELKRLPAVSRVHFIECRGNTIWPGGNHSGFRTVQESHGKMSCSEWTGVLVSTLLREAGVQKNGNWIIAEAADAGHHVKSIPIEMAMDDFLVAYGQNGEAVRPEQGYPIRMVAPGAVGIFNVKYLRRIKVVDQPYMLAAENTYADARPNLQGKRLWFNYYWQPKSVITRPSGGQRLPGPGFYEITGLAWSGGGAIRKVEVSTDGGQTWKEARLQEPVHRKAFSRFFLDWTWDGQEAVLQSRCTDDQGDVQKSLDEFAELWGYKPGSININATTGAMVNVIQPWKVDREGRVENALLA
jgi:sulfane dehydrogenase subunit SoxC